MGFLRPILLILLFTALSLAGLTIFAIIFPDSVTGSARFLVYVIGVSVLFLLFWKRYREKARWQRPSDETPETTAQHESDKAFEQTRARIRNRKKRE